ncbi:retinol dehydrogenase 14-like [Onthophagus taurus]|uniref:retinol dehydrogenase 14-like n=1 Tax=Onthophagus taurus TaxID=166361 RepID=UPI000C20FD23|nr:retinol dehydrogenase 14-like [Onthophagus taurus]
MACLIIFLTVAILLVTLKLYWKLNTKWNRSYKCLVGKTVLVTGSNTGIGYYTALDFAKRGAKVILACRNKIKGEEAQRQMIKKSGNENIILKLIDLESFESVRNFANDFNQNEERLDILVNNAATLTGLDYMTKDGFPVIIQVNHLSPFLLTHLLLHKLKKSGYSRIVNVASNMVQAGKFQPKNLGLPLDISYKRYRSSQYYADSKLCNAVCTIEMDKRLKDTNIIVNALHPGVIVTNIFDHLPKLFCTIVHSFKWLFKTIEEGAQTTLYVALSEDAGKSGGRFFNNCKDVGHYKNAKDLDFAREVYEKCEKLVGLLPEEQIK